MAFGSDRPKVLHMCVSIVPDQPRYGRVRLPSTRRVSIRLRGNGGEATPHACALVSENGNPAATLRTVRTTRRRRESLTATELAISALCSEGLTDPRIADRVFLFRHTVDFDLRQIFRKLDINSRVTLTWLQLKCNDPP